MFDAFLYQAAGASAAALFVFPTLRTDEEIADLLTSLSRNARCKLIEYAWPSSSKRQELLVGLEWETPAGLRSRALGLAPSGHMPISRRAPIVSLLIWPGGHENIYRQTNYPTVGVADMKLGVMTSETYLQLWEETKTLKRARDRLEPSHSASFREVAFCLDARVRSRLAFASSVPSTISEDQSSVVESTDSSVE